MTNPYPDWSWPKVKYELELRGQTLAAIARRLNVTPQAARLVKDRPLPRLQEAIATAIGISPMAIWPSRYDGTGQPVRRTDWLRARGKNYDGRPLNAERAA